MAGLNAARQAQGLERVVFPRTTMLGAMAGYVSGGGVSDFVPMNANFGIILPLPQRVKGGKVAKNEALAARSLEEIGAIARSLGTDGGM